MKTLTHKFIIGALVIGISFVMLMPVMAISPSSLPSVNPQVTSGVNFTFPYQYGTPTVPKDVGAQGVQGPTVPLSQIGLMLPLSQIGPQGHEGPVNDSINPSHLFNIVPASIDVHVYNGTYGGTGNVLSVGTKITMQNVTTGNITTLITNEQGWANFTLNEGWFLLQAVANYSDNFNFSSPENIIGTSVSLTVYLPSISYQISAINNGPSTDDNATLTGQVYSHLFSIYPIEVQLLNLSATGDPVISTALARDNNWTVAFTHLNAQYTYQMRENGSYQSLLNTNFGGNSPESNSLHPVSAGTYASNFASYEDVVFGTGATTTGIISGTSMPTPSTMNSNGWELTQNTTVSGGVTYLSTLSSSETYYHLKFINAVVYANFTFSSPSDFDMSFVNSTFISLATPNSNIRPFSMIHSLYLGSFYYGGANAIYWPEFANNSIMEYLRGTYYGYTGNGTWQNDTLIHISSASQTPITPANRMMYDAFFGGLLYWDSQYNSVEVKYSVFNNVSAGPTAPSNVNYVASGSTISCSFFGANDTVLGALTEPNTFISHSTFKVGLPYSINATTYKASSATIQDYINNASYDKFIMLPPPSFSLSINQYGGGTFYNDAFLSPNLTSKNTTLDAYWNSNNRSALGLAPLWGGLGINGKNITHSYFSNGATASIHDTSNSSISHDLFVNLPTPSTISGVSAAGNPLLHNDSINNNTFYMAYSNYTLENNTKDFANGGNNGGLTISWVSDPNAFVTITHNNFYAKGVGAGLPQILLGGGTNITYNVFANNATSGPNPYWSTPYTGDIRDMAHPYDEHYYIEYNYFLNLNNETVPIHMDRVLSPVIMRDNHFGFEPLPIQSHVTLGSYYIRWNGTLPNLSSQEATQYIFNTSVSAPYDNAPMWLYNITPDVKTLSGTPTISYQNGLVGGPQPDFVWKGYKYSESVEPTYIKIGVNSSKAPPVDLEFNNLLKSTAYIVYIYNNDTIWKDWAFNSNSSTNYTVTYNPANVPLDPVVLVVPWTAPPPAPPSPSGPVTITSAANSLLSELEQPYVFVPLGIFIVGAIVLISVGRRR